MKFPRKLAATVLGIAAFFLILLLLVAESFICGVAARFLPVFDYFDVLGYIMQFATDIIGRPITALWGLIL